MFFSSFFPSNSLTSSASLGFNLKERDTAEDVDVYMRIILNCILKKWGLRLWNSFLGLTTGTCGGQFGM
jgi:hypothetical protein